MSTVPLMSAAMPTPEPPPETSTATLGCDLAVLLGPRLGEVDHGVRAVVLDHGLARRPGGRLAAARTRRRRHLQASEPDAAATGDLSLELESCRHVLSRFVVVTRCVSPSMASTRSRRWLGRKLEGLLVGSFDFLGSVPLTATGRRTPSRGRPSCVGCAGTPVRLLRDADDHLVVVEVRHLVDGLRRLAATCRSPSRCMKATVRGSIALGSRPALAKTNFGWVSELRDRLGHLAAAGVVLVDEQDAERLGAGVLGVLAGAHVERLPGRCSAPGRRRARSG